MVGVGVGVVGCVPKPGFDGAWVGEFGESKATFTFSDKKNLVIDVEEDSIKVQAKGEYKLAKKNEIEISIKDIEITGASPKNIEKMKPIVKSQLKAPLKGTYQFNHLEEVAIVLNKKTQLLTRKKEEASSKK